MNHQEQQEYVREEDIEEELVAADGDEGWDEELAVDDLDKDSRIDGDNNNDTMMMMMDEDVAGEQDAWMDGEEAERAPEEDLGEILLEDDSVQGFFGHGEEPVYAIAMSPVDSNLLCSSGGDDRAFLWRVDSGEQAAPPLAGHTDSVVDVKFSHDGRYVATASMDGTVRIWDTSLPDPSAAPACQLDGPDEVTWLDWHPRGPVLAAGSHDGTVWMWKIPQGTVMGVFSGHSSAVLCGMFTPDGRHLVTGSQDSSLAVWDPKQPSAPLWKLTGADTRFHSSGILALDVSPDGQVILTGGEDQQAHLVQLQTGRILSTLSAHTDTIESVSFCKQSNLSLAATASMDGQIHVWDLHTQRIRTTCRHEDGVTQVQFFRDSSVLTSCSVDRTVREWDARTGECRRVWKGHQDTVLGFCTDGQKTISCGDDGVCLVFAAGSRAQQ